MTKLVCFPNANMRRVFMLSSDWESFDTVNWKGIAPDGSSCTLAVIDSMECVNALFDQIFDYDELVMEGINLDLARQIRMYFGGRVK
jgi:hypothetical protein